MFFSLIDFFDLTPGRIPGPGSLSLRLSRRRTTYQTWTSIRRFSLPRVEGQHVLPCVNHRGHLDGRRDDGPGPGPGPAAAPGSGLAGGRVTGTGIESCASTEYGSHKYRRGPSDLRVRAAAARESRTPVSPEQSLTRGRHCPGHCK
jgi:hypothetical protein